MIAVHHDLTFKSARQLEPVEEHVSWIQVSLATVAIPVANIVAVAIEPWRTAQFHPSHLNVADVGVAVTRIEVEHSVLSWTEEAIAGVPTRERLCEAAELSAIRDRMV